MTGEELEPLTRAKELAARLNDVLRHLPGYRVASLGTRVSIEPSNGHYFDAGLDCVAEFHAVFGAHLAKEPGLPEVSAMSAAMMAEYQTAAASWGERLKAMAQEAAEHGDTGGSLLLIRLQLCQEELAELSEAMLARDIVGCLDALTDMTYVADGTYHTLGLGHYKIAALAEVHRSNMSKLGPDGKPITSSAGRIVKGPDYSKPDLVAVLYGPGNTPESVAKGELRVNVRQPGEFGDGATVGVHAGSGRRDEPGSW